MEAKAPEQPATELQEERKEEPEQGPERRVFTRHSVDCAAIVSPVSGAVRLPGRLADLSLGGCRVVTEQRFLSGVLARVEVQFQLRGIAFRIVGVTVGSRATKSVAVRFLDLPARRRDELAEVIAEVAQINAANLAKAAQEQIPGVENESNPSVALKEPSVKGSPAGPVPFSSPFPSTSSTKVPKAKPAAPERRAHGRHTVDTSAKLLLIKTAICMPGRILNLSQGGCQLRTEERFNVGIYVRVETEFYLHGLPFRLAGVTQAIMDRNTIGVRFLDMSDRKRQHLTELIAEIAEFKALESSRQCETVPDQTDEQTR